MLGQRVKPLVDGVDLMLDLGLNLEGFATGFDVGPHGRQVLCRQVSQILGEHRCVASTFGVVSQCGRDAASRGLKRLGQAVDSCVGVLAKPQLACVTYAAFIQRQPRCTVSKINDILRV